jgi:hypothetical protein
MSAATLERPNTDSSATEVSEHAEKDDMARFLAHVVGKDGLSGDEAYVGRLSGRMPIRRLVNAGPPEAKPRPSGDDVDEFLERLEAELWANAETLGSLALDSKPAAVVHSGQLAVQRQIEHTPV